MLNCNGRIFLCCDDQYALYELNSELKWLEYLWGDAPALPTDPHERKKLKPDFEALMGPINEDSILLIPSWSKINRSKVLKFNLSTHKFSPVDWSSFYANLSKSGIELNIEGAAIYQNNYLLLNRGVKSELSSIINITPETLNIKNITKIDFGKIEGISLHGSELCIYDNYLYAMAVAEDSPNSYDDGKILGSSLAKISLQNFQIVDQCFFDRPIKSEGLCRYGNEWLVTTDPDGAGSSEFYSFLF